MLSLFPLDVLDEIWGLTESVSEGFPTYFYVFGLSNISVRSTQIFQFSLRGSFIHLVSAAVTYLRKPRVFGPLCSPAWGNIVDQVPLACKDSIYHVASFRVFCFCRTCFSKVRYRRPVFRPSVRPSVRQSVRPPARPPVFPSTSYVGPSI